MNSRVDGLVDSPGDGAVNQKDQILAILNRAKKALGVKTDVELAARLGVSRQSISKAKKRLKIPDKWLTMVSNFTNTPIKYLLSGEGPSEPNGWKEWNESSDRILLRRVIRMVEEDKVKSKLSPANKAAFIESIYELAHRMGGQVDLRKLIDSFSIKVE